MLALQNCSKNVAYLLMTKLTEISHNRVMNSIWVQGQQIAVIPSQNC